MKKILFLIIVMFIELMIGCNTKKSPNQNNYNFSGTTWSMHLKEDSYNYIWLSCDSTYIAYNDEIENHYYGNFTIENDTLMFFQLFEDDYHKFGSYPIKRKSNSRIDYLIRNDSTIELIGRDGNKARFSNVYILKQHINCNLP